VLFFAQWSNDGTKDGCLCCLVGVPPLNTGMLFRFRCLHQANNYYICCLFHNIALILE
jgi:hypothetical protein